MASEQIFIEPGAGKTLQVLADRIRVLAAAGQTGGKLEVFELCGSQGSGPPPHSHAWDEAYYILDGELELRVGNSDCRAGTGAFVLAPGGVAHTFKIVSPSARFVVLTTGSGASDFFEAMDREIGFPPPSFDKVCEVAMRQGLSLA